MPTVFGKCFLKFLLVQFVSGIPDRDARFVLNKLCYD